MNVTRSLSIALAVLPLLAQASEWSIDTPHTNAQFAVRHMMVSTVRGQFQKVTGTVQLDERDLTRSRIEVAIDPSTVDTRDAKRDAHLRSADFFDIAKFPKMTFTSTSVQKRADGGFNVMGNLTLHGVTRPVTLHVQPLGAPVKSPWGQTVRGVSATGELNRKDFGLNWNQALEAGGVLVGDQVQLQIDAELVEKPGKTASN